ASRGKKLMFREGDEERYLQELSSLILERHPDLDYIGATNIARWVQYVSLAILSHETPDTVSRDVLGAAARAIPLRYDRLPGNPFPLPDSLKDLPPKDVVKHLLEIRNLHRALQPARPPGRPRKPENVRKVEAGSKLKPLLAVRASRLYEQRKPWPAIARALF